jgi:hypothetical protein
MKRAPSVLLLLLPVAACAPESRPVATPTTSTSSSTSTAASTDASGLAGYRFVRGRIATADDVASGDAIFAASADGAAVTPIDVPIPQYVRCKDAKVGVIKGVLVQAESAQGMSMAGVRMIDGGKRIVLLSSCEQLGETKP